MTELKLIIVPDPDEPDGASLFVDCLIDGIPYRFLLDTGAGRSQVIADAYTSSLPAADTHNSSGVFARSSHDAIRVARIEIGPIAKQDFILTRVPSDHPVQNLLGMDILQHVCCHFRFDEARIVIDPPAASLSDFAFQPLWVDAKYHPYVDVQFGAHAASAVWDTGASITVADLALIAAHPTHFEPVGTSVGTDSTGAQMETPMYLMSGAQIGGMEFAPHRVAGVDLSHINTTLERRMNLILGYNTLRQTNWLFDFPRKRWAITKLLTH